MGVRLFYFHVTYDIAIKLISANPMLYKLRNLVTASNLKSFYSVLFEPKLICYIILLIILIKKIIWIKILTQLIICLFYTKENTQTAFAHTDSTNTPKKTYLNYFFEKHAKNKLTCIFLRAYALKFCNMFRWF